MKKISLLGATGSIGLQTIDIILENQDKFKLVALSSGRNIEKTREIITQLQPEIVSVQEESDALALAKEFPNVQFTYGNKGLIEVATLPKTAFTKTVVSGLSISIIVPSIASPRL